MAIEDDLQRQLGDLHRRIAELTEQLRLVTEERNAAFQEIGRMRRDQAIGKALLPEPKEAASPLVEICSLCEGEGVYWVHDFEMPCKRCSGTGNAPKGSTAAPPDRH